MANGSRPLTDVRTSVIDPGSNGKGREIHNKILLALPPSEFQILLPKLEYLGLNLHQTLHEPGDTLKSLYFVNSGLVSVLTVFPDGKGLEVGLIGKEGFVGSPLLAGFRTANTRSIVQIEGSAFRVDAEAFTGILPSSRLLDRSLQQYAHTLAMEVNYLAACNRLHEVRERLARWLLMSSDRIDSSHVPLTQDLLADMLGTRRSSVTVAAGMLEGAGLILNTRGDIEILDRKRLESAACDCYRTMNAQRAKWQSEAMI
jgi:CRP-like cAMP-binding protein